MLPTSTYARTKGEANSSTYLLSSSGESRNLFQTSSMPTITLSSVASGRMRSRITFCERVQASW